MPFIRDEDTELDVLTVWAVIVLLALGYYVYHVCC